MWLRLALLEGLAVGAQAFAPAPIQWAPGTEHGKTLVVAPKGFASKPLPLSTELPAILAIVDPSSSFLASEIPRFTAEADNTITWDGQDLCIEASGDKAGDTILVNHCTGRKNQRWIFLPWPRDQKIQIQLKDTNKCIDVNDKSGVLNGAPVELRECGDRVAEAWRFEEPLPATEEGPKFWSGFGAASLMAAVGALSLGAFLWQKQHRARALAVNQGYLTAPLSSERNMLAVMALGPKSDEKTGDETIVDVEAARVDGAQHIAGQPFGIQARLTGQSQSVRSATPFMVGGWLSPSSTGKSSSKGKGGGKGKGKSRTGKGKAKGKGRFPFADARESAPIYEGKGEGKRNRGGDVEPVFTGDAEDSAEARTDKRKDNRKGKDKYKIGYKPPATAASRRNAASRARYAARKARIEKKGEGKGESKETGGGGSQLSGSRQREDSDHVARGSPPDSSDDEGKPEPLSATLCSQLTALSGLKELNSLQLAALPHVFAGSDVIVHAETGSGKTFCFALPLVHSIMNPGGNASARTNQRVIRALVLSPTLELCVQTARVLNTLSPGCAIALTGMERDREADDIDAPIVVAPPVMALNTFAEERSDIQDDDGELDFEEEDHEEWLGDERSRFTSVTKKWVLKAGLLLKTLILDEADAMLMPLSKYATLQQKASRARHPKAAAILIQLLADEQNALKRRERRKRENRMQIIAASATVGRPLRRELARLSGRAFQLARPPEEEAESSALSDIEAKQSLTTTSAPASLGDGTTLRAVKLPASMELSVLICEEDNVLAAVHQAINDMSPTSTLLFIPEGRKASAELRLIQQCDLPEALPLSAALASPEANTKLMVASTSVARGLDLPYVDLVILLGLPATADRLVHLAGRTARQGVAGKVVVVANQTDCDGRLGTIASQLDLDASMLTSRVLERNEKWAKMWTVHQKLTQADVKYK